MAIRRTVAALTLVALAGCATETPQTEKAAQELTSEQVTFGEQLAQIRGHHLAAVELYEDDDTEGAATHTGHPVSELLDSVSSDIRERDEELASKLGPALRAASRVVADREPVAELRSAVAAAAEVVEQAEAAVVGDLRTTPRYRGSVVAALLQTVVGEYGEAVQDGRVALLAEWQDGYAFKEVAKNIYGQIRNDVREASAEEAAEIDDAFEALDAALPALEPPANPRDAAEVERAATTVGAELEETVDALVVQTRSPEEAFDNIENLLTRILQAYRAGNTEEAAELAAQAYLENYEIVEADVIRLAPDVNEELEPLLGAELRARIREGAPADEIASMVERARTLLRQARTAVVEEH